MLKNKKGLILGIANDHSIAWGIAKTLGIYGANIALSYQNESMLKRIKPLAEKLGSDFLIPCDVSKKNDITNCFNTFF